MHVAKRVIAVLANSVNFMIRTKVTQLVKGSVLPVVRRLISALGKSAKMNRTKLTQLVKASVLPAVRRDITAATSINCINIIKATPIQPEREKPIWKDIDARRELKLIFWDDKDRKYHAMPVEELRDLQEFFKVYTKSIFKNYTMVLKNEVMKENKNWPKPWTDNTAEAHVKTLLLQGF